MPEDSYPRLHVFLFVLSLRIIGDYYYFCSPGYLYTRQPFLQLFGDFVTADRDSACMELHAGKMKIQGNEETWEQLTC